jgi:hypothetical protein
VERWYTKLALCLLPLALVPALFFALAQGYLNLGGGEKDIIVVFPLASWAIIYAVTFAVMWGRNRPTKVCVWRGAVTATLPLLLGWLALFVWEMVKYRT